MSVTAASSREPMRNVSSSPSPTKLHGDDHARAGDTGVRGRRRADLRVPQQLVELADPRLHLSLLVLGSVVAAVLLQVAFGAGGGDALR